MLLAQNASPTVVLVLIALFFLMGVVVLVMFSRVFTLWLQAMMSGTPVMMLEIIGMQFRKTDVRAVVKALIMAKQAGVVISCREMEQAYLQGCDINKLTLAMIRAYQENIEVTFQELVKADLDGRLAEKLAGSRQ